MAAERRTACSRRRAESVAGRSGSGSGPALGSACRGIVHGALGRRQRALRATSIECRPMQPRCDACQPEFPYRRINVVGTSAAGKTTFARALAARLDVPYVELDALHWEADWTEAPDEVMRQRVADATAGDGVGGRWQLLGGARHRLGSCRGRRLARLPAAHGAVALRRPAPGGASAAARSCGPAPATASACRPTCSAATACCGGSSAPTTAGGASTRACWPRSRGWRGCDCVPLARPKPGWAPIR